MTTTNPTPEPKTINGPWLTTARLLWLAYFLAAVALSAVNASPRWDQLTAVCVGNGCPSYVLTPHGAATLDTWGYSIGAYAIFIIGIDIVIMAVYYGLAVFIFRQRANQVISLLTSFALLYLGAGMPETNFALIDQYPTLYNLFFSPSGIAFGAILFLYPDGRFVPHWMRYFALALIVISPISFVIYQYTPSERSLILDLAITIPTIIIFLISLYGQVIRVRQAQDLVQRQQYKWALFGILSFLISTLLWGLLFEAKLLSGGQQPDLAITVFGYLLVTFLSLILPISMSFSILRYRLWDIDLVINRALVYGIMTMFVIGLYVLVVGGFSALFHTQNNFLLSLIATGLVAVAFQPIREKLQAAVNQWTYGNRDNPTDILSQLGKNLETASEPEAAIAGICQTIKSTLKLPYAAVLIAGQDLPVAHTGQAGTQPTQTYPMLYQGSQVGELIVSPRISDTGFSTKDAELLAQLATQAGAVIHAYQLSLALRQSRTRIVTAVEEERLRLRRDLHDGLGADLASVGLKVTTAKRQLQRQPDQANTTLDEIAQLNQRIISEVRHIVHDLRPPALDSLGLPEAILDHFYDQDPGAVPQIEIVTPAAGLPPLNAATDVAAYRIILEALTNVIRHAQAKRCWVTFSQHNDFLVIQIKDDGAGLPASATPGIGLTSMQERAEALGGRFQITSNLPQGTIIEVQLPLIEIANV